MKIYGSDGRLIIEVEVDDNSYRNRVIMGDHNITLYFSLAQHVEIPVGAYCDYQNERFTLERPEALKMKHSRHFEYTVRMESYEAKAKIWMFRNPVDGRLKFSLTAKPHEHLQMFVDNMNRRDSGWSIGHCVEGSEVLITYDRVKCYEALGLMAQQLNTEYEFNGKQVSLRKVEYNKSNPLPLSYGRGNGFKPNVGRSNSSENPPVEILFVQGGDRNIDRSKYGAGELLLPALQTIGYDGEHFEDESGYNSATARRYVVDDLGLSIRRLGGTLTNSAEDSLDCTDIYPKRVGEVSGVVVVNAEKNFYDIIDEGIPSNLDYSACQIEGETMTIVFQSGMLAGREFDVNYFHEPSGTPNTSGYKAGRRFEIVPAEIDGVTMPNATFCPSAHDTYAVFNCSLPPSYIRDDATKSGASWDMFRAAVRYMFDNEEQKFTFKGELDGLWAKKDWVNIGSRIVLGGYVEFYDDRFQQEGVLVRITGIKDYINNPHSPVIELSNETVSSGFSSELNRLASAEVIISENHRDALNFTKRRFRDAKETMSMLEEAMLNGYTESVSPLTVQTMQMLVGDESLQFRFVNNVTNPVTVAHTFTFDAATKKFSTAGGILQHLTLGIGDLSSAHAVGDYMFWPVSAYESAILNSPSKKYYLYIKADRNKTTHYGHGEANFLLSETPIGMTAVADSYHFLVGILNSESGGERSFVTLYGFSEILPGRITTDRVVSGDGTSYFDLAANAMKLGDLLRFNDQGDGKLVLKGTFVQSTGGEAESPIGCYRGVWNSAYTYYYGDEVTYTTDGYTATYRYISETSSKGKLPTNTAYWQVIAKGANASRIVSVFKVALVGTTPSKPTQAAYPPTGWSKEPPTRSDNSVLWMSQCTISGDGTYGTWSTPVRISGDKGAKGDKGDTGADGTDIEFIYKQSNSLPTADDKPTNEASTDDYVPTGWSDNPNGVSTTYKYEWMCVRTKQSGSSAWTDWSIPVVWSAYGEQGIDGDGFDYIFKRYALEPSNLNAPLSLDEDGYVPSGWTDNPQGVTSTRRFEYVSTRKKTNGHWGAFTKPALWAKYASDGQDGQDGKNANYQEYRYAVNGSNIEPPTLDTSSRNPAGWDTAVPAVGALQYLWMTVALINGETEGMIEAWSTPVRHTPIYAIDLGENLVDNSEAKDIIGVLDSNPFQDLSPKNQYAALSKTLCNIPADGTILSCQVRVTLSGCSFKSGGGHIVIYMDGTNAWPIIAEKKNFTANGTYDLMNEGVAYNWYGGTMLNKISARLNNFYEGGTVTIERVKVEVGRRCSAWSLSEADKRGPAITYRGVYNSAKTYEGNRTHIDCVKYGDQYYVARTDAGSFTGKAPTDTSKWNPFGATFESVATELLLAENANIAGWIFRNGRLESQRQNDGEPMAYLDGNTGEMRLRGTIQLSTGCEGDISDNNIVFLPKLSSGETRYLSMGTEKEDIGKVVRLFNSSIFGGGRYYIEANTFEVEEDSDFQMTMFGFNYNSIIDPQEIIEMTCFERPSTTQGRKCGQWVLTGRFGTDSFKRSDAKGRFARVLAMGKLGGNASTVGISGMMYDGRSLSSAGFTITRTGTGSYTVSFPSGTITSGYYVFFTGYGANLKGSYMNDTNTGFKVVVSDDSSYNDGEVVFMILDSNWWYSMLA